MEEQKLPEYDFTEPKELSEESEQTPLALAREIYTWLETFAVTLMVLLLAVTFLGRYAPVDGGSMNLTLRHEDFVILSGVGYTPKQGDIVVVQSKGYGYDKPLVKRVIATGGQTVTLDYENWAVIVDGVLLDEPYVFYRSGEWMDDGNVYVELPSETFTVPQGKLFVMGDNRNDSLDSRYSAIGYIDERLVVGRVLYRVLPFSAFGRVE